VAGRAISTCKGLVNQWQKQTGCIGSMWVVALSALQRVSSEAQVLLPEIRRLAVVTCLTKRGDVLGQETRVICAVRTVAAGASVSIRCWRMGCLFVELLFDPFMAGTAQRTHGCSQELRVGAGVRLVTRSAVIDRWCVVGAAGGSGCRYVMTLGTQICASRGEEAGILRAVGKMATATVATLERGVFWQGFCVLEQRLMALGAQSLTSLFQKSFRPRMGVVTSRTLSERYRGMNHRQARPGTDFRMAFAAKVALALGQHALASRAVWLVAIHAIACGRHVSDCGVFLYGVVVAAHTECSGFGTE
jgi:hypothetical protein